MTLKKKNVVLHIGFHKTGTTTLQTSFFPKYSAYAGKLYFLDPKDAAALVKTSPHFRTYKRLEETFRQFSGNRPPSVNGWQKDLSRWVDELVFDESGLLIISDEKLSREVRGRSEVVPVQYGSPIALGTRPITIFLSELRDLLPQEINLTTIVTLRNQSDFLGSLAAQLGKERYFDSSSFHQLVTHGGPYLDFNQFVRDLENVSGAQNHLTLLFEDGLETNMSKIVDLIGPPDLDTEFDPGGEIPAENVRRSGASSWTSQGERLTIVSDLVSSAAFRTLRRRKWWPLIRTLFGPLYRPLVYLLRKIQNASVGPVTVRISDADRLRIRAICHKSNGLLAAHLNRNLFDLGY